MQDYIWDKKIMFLACVILTMLCWIYSNPNCFVSDLLQGSLKLPECEILNYLNLAFTRNENFSYTGHLPDTSSAYSDNAATNQISHVKLEIYDNAISDWIV